MYMGRGGKVVEAVVRGSQVNGAGGGEKGGMYMGRGGKVVAEVVVEI